MGLTDVLSWSGILELSLFLLLPSLAALQDPQGAVTETARALALTLTVNSHRVPLSHLNIHNLRFTI